MDKQTIINNFTKKEFMDFLTSDNNKKILQLLDEEGINILNNSQLKNDRIGYILTFSTYKNELMKNISFIDVLLNSNILHFYSGLANLNNEACECIFKRGIELNSPSLVKVFKYFNNNYKLNKIENWNESKDLLYEILKIEENPLVIKKIINNHNIDLTNNNINLRYFFENAKHSTIKAQGERLIENEDISGIEIPPTMITKEVAEKLWNDYNIFGVRAIINDAYYCTDATLLNNYVKNKEDYIIQNFNEKIFLYPFQELYESFKKYKLAELMLYRDSNSNYDDYYNYKLNFIKLLNKLDKTDYYEKFENLFKNEGIKGVKKHLKNLNDNYLSNYIIDFHFEENYHNIMLDIRELLNFYYNGYTHIPKSNVELYDKISNIDYLSNEEKIQLHENLKNFNIKEMFYDDMLFARNIVAESIKEYSLSTQTLQQYKDEKLSKLYGVDVYKFDGEEFFGIVKSNRKPSDNLPVGHSYSLIGTNGIAIYGDPNEPNTYLYDSNDMNPQQLIHAFPFDSFTYYHPFESTAKASFRVNMLAMPEELVETSSYSYNELLILEKGTIETDMNKYIPELKRIALYCLDEIKEQDIQVAKNQGVGIMLINSKKYTPKNNAHLYPYHNSIEHYNNDYFDGFNNESTFEARR